VRKLSPLEQAEALRMQKVILIVPRADVSLKVRCAIGEASMQDAIYGPILDALADHKPKTIAQLEQQLKDKNIAFAQLTQAIMLLTGNGSLAAVQDDALTQKAKKASEKINTYLIDKARGSADISYLSSPLTGGGIAVNRFQQLFLLALSQGRRQSADWAPFVWQILAAQGQKIVKDGAPLQSAEANLAELASQANNFAQKYLPILKVLQIA
jgi:hypothetical protein